MLVRRLLFAAKYLVLAAMRRNSTEYFPTAAPASNSVGVDIIAAVAFHFIEPCLPSPGERPPTGPGWVHEIKHDGYRLMARRDALSVGIRLLTRNGHDWAPATHSLSGL